MADLEITLDGVDDLERKLGKLVYAVSSIIFCLHNSVSLFICDSVSRNSRYPLDFKNAFFLSSFFMTLGSECQ